MKSIKALLVLAFAASFASGSCAAEEPAAPLIKVPKNEAAMQATRATTARDAANNPAKPAAHKAGKPSTHKAAKPDTPKTGKPSTHKTGKPDTHKAKAKPGKAVPAKKHQAKAPAAKK